MFRNLYLPDVPYKARLIKQPDGKWIDSVGVRNGTVYRGRCLKGDGTRYFRLNCNCPNTVDWIEFEWDFIVGAYPSSTNLYRNIFHSNIGIGALQIVIWHTGSILVSKEAVSGQGEATTKLSLVNPNKVIIRYHQNGNFTISINGTRESFTGDPLRTYLWNDFHLGTSFRPFTCGIHNFIIRTDQSLVEQYFLEEGNGTRFVGINGSVAGLVSGNSAGMWLEDDRVPHAFINEKGYTTANGTTMYMEKTHQNLYAPGAFIAHDPNKQAYCLAWDANGNQIPLEHRGKVRLNTNSDRFPICPELMKYSVYDRSTPHNVTAIPFDQIVNTDKVLTSQTIVLVFENSLDSFTKEKVKKYLSQWSEGFPGSPEEPNDPDDPQDPDELPEPPDDYEHPNTPYPHTGDGVLEILADINVVILTDSMGEILAAD